MNLKVELKLNHVFKFLEHTHHVLQMFTDFELGREYLLGFNISAPPRKKAQGVHEESHQERHQVSLDGERL